MISVEHPWGTILAAAGGVLVSSSLCQLFERRGECNREAPDCARSEEFVNRARQVFRCFQFAFNERLVDDHLRGDISKFTPLPDLHLLSHRLEVALHPVDANRDAINERERLRVFG